MITAEFMNAKERGIREYGKGRVSRNSEHVAKRHEKKDMTERQPNVKHRPENTDPEKASRVQAIRKAASVSLFHKLVVGYLICSGEE